MANPTVPFSWQMPEPTDLVTNLPADFEVFGQAVATDLQYLLGGTTGQVLAKASGTDLDFDWVTDASGMTNPMTTTSDMIYSSSGSTPARIGVGSNGDVLTVTAGVTGWVAPAGGGKVLQVVQSTYATATSNSTTTLADTGLTLNITPTSASSKVLLWMFMPTAKTDGNSGNSVILQLQRDGTNVLQAYEMHKTNTSTIFYGSTTLTYLDSPSTTSATTYKVQFRNRLNTAEVVICQDDQLAVLIAAEIGA